MRIVKDLILYILGFWPELLFRIKYYKELGQFINLKKPKTLYDKIAYLMFRTDTRKWSVLADKIEVRKYIEKCGFGQNVPKIYGIWNDANDINFEILPKQFVLKTNNASATNIIVVDKGKINIAKTRKLLNKWLSKKYGRLTAQPHYSLITPRILAEEFLIDNNTTKKGQLLVDYKFFCINGEPRYVQVMYDRVPNTHDVKLQLFDMNWCAHPEYISDVHDHSKVDIDIPISFNQMKEFTRTLSKEFSFVRVDLYEINGKPIFGELTFTPGFDTFSQTFMEILGQEIQL